MKVFPHVFKSKYATPSDIGNLHTTHAIQDDSQYTRVHIYNDLASMKPCFFFHR
ncbi:predicted protein [Botrytis cinerea T4]|uniref:Uncharacterized protein n=1 Tax=Botryotinia fuckeliana (strain T4) TaxID=999810 RepID=G2YFZ6_BOTF4|nr:predicted protein [Botrytis cinerea T4]